MRYDLAAGATVAREEAMGGLVWIVIALVPLMTAIAEIRDLRRQGWRPNWRKSLTTTAGAVIVTLLMLGMILFGVASNSYWPMFGGIAVFIFGLYKVTKYVNRRWPKQPPYV